MEEKVHCRQPGEYSQRQGHLRELRVDITMSHMRRWEEGKEEEGVEYDSGAAAKRAKGK